MFKGFMILEQHDDKVKLKHISTGDILWKYRAYCISCGSDRGFHKRSRFNAKCNRCSQHDKFIENVDAAEFPNIDFTDKKICFKPSKGSETRYRATCKKCSKDRGFIALSDAIKLCRSCCRKQIHANKSIDAKMEIAKKISMAQTGVGQFNGFKTKESDKQRAVFKAKKLSKECFERDKYTCQVCSLAGVELNAHHLNSFAHFPTQRFDIDNLITLCKLCHKAFHSLYGNGKSTANTKEQYLQFKDNMCSNKKSVYILTGAPASGKSWVGSKVTTLNVLDSDLIPKKSLVDKVASADRPLLILTIGVSTFIKRNPQWNYKLIVIQEDEGVIKDRMIGRNGAVTDTIKRRIKRMISLAKQAQFTGTSAEVLQYLNSI